MKKGGKKRIFIKSEENDYRKARLAGEINNNTLGNFATEQTIIGFFGFFSHHLRLYYRYLTLSLFILRSFFIFRLLSHLFSLYLPPYLSPFSLFISHFLQPFTLLFSSLSFSLSFAFLVIFILISESQLGNQ